nr:MAG TPA: hypothetical protein [Caudoviricetes sp.]
MRYCLFLFISKFICIFVSELQCKDKNKNYYYKKNNNKSSSI